MGSQPATNKPRNRATDEKLERLAHELEGRARAWTDEQGSALLEEIAAAARAAARPTSAVRNGESDAPEQGPGPR